MKQSIFKTITSNTLYQATGKGIAIFFSLITTALLTRYLGQSGYGQYTLITTLIIFLGSLTDWGSGFIATRMASKENFPPSLIYGNLLILRIFTSSIGALILLIITVLKIIDLPISLIILGSLIIFVLALRHSLQVVFQVHLKLQFSAMIEVITSFFFLIFTYLAVIQTLLTPQSAVMFLLIASIIASITALFFASKLTTFQCALDYRFIKSLIKESAPMGALLVVFSIYNRLDSFLLQHFQGDQAVGVYGIAYKVHDNLVMGAAFFMNAMYPIIAKSGTQNSKSHQKGHFKKTQKLFATSFHLLLIAGLIVSITFYIFAQPVILILAGSSYLPAVLLVRILMVATFIAYLNHLTGYTLAALGYQKISLYIASSALFVNIILNYFFIPIYSYNASAYITIVTEAIVLIFTLLYLTKRQNLHPNLSSFYTTIRNLLFNRKKLF